MRKANHAGGKIVRWFQSYWLLVMVGLIGLLLTQITTGVLRDIGIAFITALALGFTLDIGFKTRLARNVFEVAFGYLLPPRIRAETRWIYSLELLAVHHQHDIVIIIHPSNDAKVRVEETTTRKIKNICDRPIKMAPNVGVHEWFHTEEETEILSFQYTHSEGESGSLDDRKVAIQRKQGHIIAAKAIEELTLYPGDTVTIVGRIIETKWRNDATYSFHSIATSNPQLSVKVPPELDYTPVFQSRRQGDLLALGSGRFELKGTLLPRQGIRLRWWDREASKEWEERHESEEEEKTTEK